MAGRASVKKNNQAANEDTETLVEYEILRWDIGQATGEPSGVDYHPFGDPANELVRHETGDVVSDLPPHVIKPWIAQGYIAVYVKPEETSAK